MSMSGQIMVHVASKSASELQRLDPATLAHEMGGLDNQRVSKLLWSLENTGRLELIREAGHITGIARVIRVGRKIVAATHTPAASSENRPGHPRGPQPVKGIRTPQLDRYESAKLRAQAIKGDDEYISVTFREDPMAEEALRLKEALIKLQTDYADLSTKYRMVIYEYDGVKERMRANAAKDVHAFRAQADSPN